MIDSVFIYPIVITDENTVPVFNQCFKGFLGSVGVNQKETDLLIYHGPEPFQFTVFKPGGLIDAVDTGSSGDPADALINGFYGF